MAQDGGDEVVTHSLHRPGALADGVFAIAMTLLALEIRLPDGAATEEEFRAQLPALFVGLAVFAAAFLVTSRFWIAQHRVLARVHHIDDRGLSRLMTVLLCVAALPIAMDIVLNRGGYPDSVAIAGGLLALTSLLGGRLYAHVLRPPFSDVEPAERRRTVVQTVLAAAVYLLAIPLAYGLDALGVAPGWAALVFFLIRFVRPLGDRFAVRT